MRKFIRNHQLALTMVMTCLAFVMVGCDADSPTAPQQTPAPSPGPVPGTDTYAITVTANPDELDVAAGGSSLITVTVRGTGGTPNPPDGSTVLLSTTDGTLTSNAGTSGTSVPVVLTGRTGTATLTVTAAVTDVVTVQARLADSIGQASVRLEEVEVPEEPTPAPLFIESVSPNVGPPSGGTRVTIRGTGFEVPVRVSFGGIPGVVESVSETQVIARTPSIDLPTGQTLTVPVQVDVNVNEDGAATDSLGNAFTYTRGGTAPPVPIRILSVTPTFGPNEGGTRVTILGEGFSSAVQVFFGDALIEAEVQSVAPTRIVALTPSAFGANSVNQDSIVSVTVINLDTGASFTRQASFQYGSPEQQVIITSAGPTEGPSTGGTLVTVNGQGFEEPVAVEAGGVGQIPISVSGTKVVFQTVPVAIENCADVEGAISIVNIETGAGATGPNFVYRVIEPVIFSVDPNTSGEDGGIQATIIGSGFTSPLRVSFGTGPDAVNVSATVIDSGTIVVTVPPFAGEFDEVSCGSDGMQFVPTRVDVTIENLLTDCTDTVENGFTYVPDDTSCREPAPEASFAVSVSGFTAFVNDTTPGLDGSETRTWNFGDGTIISPAPASTSHTYAAPGTYTITLTLAGDFGTTTATQTITIEEDPEPPVASFTFTTMGLTANFTDTSSGGPTSWDWDFGDGATSTQPSPSHTYAMPGTYSVSLTVTNDDGSDTIIRDVTVA